MGSNNADIDGFLAKCGDCQRDWFTDEQPQHTVYLDAYWMDKTEVTNAQYHKCVDTGTCQAPTICDWGDPTYKDDAKADHPVACVGWDDAAVYCQWAGARLPTEAEWEKAARGTDGHQYPWGDSAPDCSKAQIGDCDRQTVPVGSKPAGAGPYGTLDMAGNFWEWVADWYASDYYGSSPERNPQGPATGQSRVLRGGGWYDNWNNTRAADRSDDNPMIHGNDDLGFRCTMSPGG